MQEADYEELSALFQKGLLDELSEKLKPFLDAGDQDAIFLSAHFSLDVSESGDAMDARAKKVLESLAQDFHPRSLYVVAWHHFHGDDGFPRDRERFRNYLTAAALLGHTLAISDLAELLEQEMNWQGFLERLKHT